MIVENPGEGTDTVLAGVNYTLSANLENLTLTGSAVSGTGNADANVITGDALDNVLDGAAGADTLRGLAGNDTYVIDAADTIDETDPVLGGDAGGIDTVQASFSYTLGANLENLTLTGSAAINGTGNSLNNVLSGNAAANVLDGGTGNDTMIGGLGNDTYLFARGAGNDLVSDTDATAGNVDTVQMAAGILASDVSGSRSGNDLVLRIAGTSDTLTLGSFFSGASSEIERVAFADGTVWDVNVLRQLGTINGTSGADSLTGTSGDDQMFGLAGNDTLNGLGGNDYLDGGAGNDSMAGGAGDDTYIVDSATDIVTEGAGAGTDTVQSSITLTLGSNVENLILTGTGNINGTGNTLANSITGNSGNNTLSGGTGADTMAGGAGDDSYVVDNAGDVVTELPGEGADTVSSSVTYALSANVENLTLTGTSAVNGTGNALDNVLTGNSGANVLTGGAGNDTYVVGTGDSVVENANEGTDTVQSSITFTLGNNVENLTLTGTTAINGTGNALDNVLTGNSGTNVLTGGAGNDTYVVGTGDSVVENANAGTDTVQSSVTFTLGNNVENLVLTGTTAINGTGNTLNNSITGNAGNNTLDGGAGADTLIGGQGNDTYTVDNIGDVVTELAGEGTDLVNSSVTYVLSANVENLTLTGTSAVNGTGNALDNALTGNSGANVLTGGTGNDTYVVGTGDSVVENANEGTDTVQSSITFTLGNNVENLTLTGTTAINGTGNALDNVLTGNTGVNVLTGGAGNDTYVVGTGDSVIENANEGTDTVQSSITFTLGNNVENLTLTGTTAINGTGNTLNNVLTGNSVANTLTGAAGNDTLDGGTGNDTMLGGTGDDTYVVDVSTDVVTENANEGNDTIQSLVTLTLGNNVENLMLTGSNAVNGTGNTLNNLVRGNAGNNTLNGAAGFDVLEGAGGNDTLTDTSGGNYLNGGAGTDTLTGGTSADFLMGGTGNDTISTGNGADILAFNVGDGQDSVNPSVGTDDTLSLGGSGLDYANLNFQKSGNNLILNVSATDKITFTNWYASSANKNVLNLQVVAEAMAGFNPGGGNALLDNKVEEFNFQGLVGAFDAALAANPTLTSWALTNGLTQFQLAGSDTAALGGDLAYYYGLNGTVAGIGFDKAQDVVTGAGFGTQTQTLRPLASLQDGVSPLS